MLRPELVELALISQAFEAVGRFTERHGWGAVNERGQANRAINGHTATRMVERGGKVDSV